MSAAPRPVEPDEGHPIRLPDAAALIEAAGSVDREFQIFLTTLLYTGMRLSEGLSLTVDRIDLGEGYAFLPKTKNSVRAMADAAGLRSAPVLSDGPPLPVEPALAALGAEGSFGATGGPEGVVYRVERKGEVDFLAKYVRPDKIDGAYLPEISGQSALWNWQPESFPLIGG